MNATVGVGTTSVLGHFTRAMILCIECSIYLNVDSEAAKSRATGPEKASNPISGL
jgi:hypothetical protein